MPYDVADFKIDPLLLTTPRARLEYLRDFLRALPPERFDVSGWFTGAGNFVDRQPATVTRDCGTAACVAGWTWTLFLPRKRLRSIQARAADILGLSEAEGWALFYPPEYRRGQAYTPAHAATVLDHLLATGEVDWSVAPSS